MNEPYDLIQTVQLTEKASLLSEKLNKYVFRVSPRANKIQIKEAVEKLFDVDVVKVATIIMPLKRSKRGRKFYQRTPEWKKAIVTLHEGQSIPLFNA